MKTMIRVCIVTVLTLISIFLTGCESPYKKAAKEWCMSIRACQMIPVYPLSQDIRPGDVYLVQSTISSQAEEYEDRGFLALDDLRIRLPLESSAYTNMYSDSYFKSEISPPCPYPTIPGADTGIMVGTGRVNTALSTTQVARVAFPSYSFTIERGESLSVGAPISSIPVALNYLGARKTAASVTLANASSYQIDHETVMKKLTEWARSPSVQAELKAACDYTKKDYVFLRVIKRVYLVGAVDVTLENKDAYKSDVQVGMAEQVADSKISTENFDANIAKQAKLLSTLSALASTDKIGGSVSFNSATSRSVGLRQSFDKPLVIGYLGVDVPFFKDGRIGAAIPTFGHLTKPAQYSDPKPVEFRQLLDVTLLLKALSKDPETQSIALATIVDFCPKAGCSFQNVGQEATKLLQTIQSGKTLQQSDVDICVMKLIDEINFGAATTPANRKNYRDLLRASLTKQGI